MIRPCLALALGLSFAACTPSTADVPPPATASSEAPAGDRAGTVVKITADIWAVTPVDQPTMRYCFEGPLATPALRREGQSIRFSGTPGAIPPNVRRACSPFTFTTALAAAAPASAPAPSGVVAAATPASPPAAEPVSVLCARVPEACAPFARATLDAEACGRAGKCAVASVGTCGALSFIERVEGFSSTTRYYDAGGALVRSCSGNIEHGGSLCFGAALPVCTRKVDRKLGPAE